MNAHQSAFNKLAQFGQASRATKTAGSYGGVSTPTVSVGIDGNMHFSQYVPMERGESGSHHACAKERLLIATQEPVQPHQALPEDYVMPDGHQAFKWVPLVPAVAKLLSLSKYCGSPAIAADSLPRAAVPSPEAPEEVVKGVAYVPDSSGFKVQLPDGVSSQLRFARDASAASGFVTEWRVANRSFALPPKHSLEKCTLRVLSYFAKPHTSIDPDEDALAMHQSFQGAYNVLGGVCREDGDVTGGARLGAAPWHLGMLATVLCIFDIFCGRYDDKPEYLEKRLKVQAEHVIRASELLELLIELKEIAVNTSDESPADTAAAAMAMVEERRSKLMQHLRNDSNAFDGLWSQHHFARFDSAGAEAEQSLGAEEDAAEEGEEEEEEVPEAPAQYDVQELEEAPQDHGGQGEADKLLTEGEVRDMNWGYGDNGKSVQSSFHAKGLTDREIMKRTLLAGTPAIASKKPCERMKSSRAGGNEAKPLPKEAWAAVMKAGLSDCLIARWDENQKTVFMSSIPEEPNARVKYHNSLMQLCGVSLQALIEAMKEAKATAEAKAAAKAKSATRGQAAAPSARQNSARRSELQPPQPLPQPARRSSQSRSRSRSRSRRG